MPVVRNLNCHDMQTLTTEQKRVGSGWGVADLVMGLAPLLIGVELLAWIFFLPSALLGHSSFRQLYTAGYMVRTGHGHELYDYDVQKNFQNRLVSPEPMVMPFIRPPFDAVAYAPFSLVSYRTAYLVLLLINVFLLALVLHAIRDHTENLRQRYRSLPVAMFASFIPVASALMMGQDSILLLALLSWSMLALERRKDGTAGTLAALGLFKFHLVLPIALLLLCWRRFRFFAAFSCLAVLLAAISVWAAGAHQVRLYLGSLLSIGKGTAGPQQLLRYPLPVTMMANVHGLVTGMLGAHFKPLFGIALVLLIAAGVLVSVALVMPPQCGATWAMPVAITASVFVSYYLFAYDLAVLLLPLTMMLNRSLPAEASKPDRFMSISCVLLFLAPACLFFLQAYFYLVSLFVLLFLIAQIRSAKKECREPLVATCP